MRFWAAWRHTGFTASMACDGSRPANGSTLTTTWQRSRPRRRNSTANGVRCGKARASSRVLTGRAATELRVQQPCIAGAAKVLQSRAPGKPESTRGVLMSRCAKLIAAAAAACIAVPAAAQYNPYPNQPGYNYPAYPGQPYPQQYPGQPYPGQQYPYGYPGGTVGGIIDQLLGNRYNVSDRQAIGRC